MEKKPCLSIVGCGQVGTVLGALWHSSGVFEVEALVDVNLEKVRRAGALIGSGAPHESLEVLPPSDVILLAVPDDALISCAEALSAQATIKPGAIIFHCSGATPSEALGLLRKHGASVASMHPLRSFADFNRAVDHFRGTYCGFEGDAEARDILIEAFEEIGAEVFELDPSKKAIYHAASIFVSNYINALIEVGLSAFEEAGVAREVALKIIAPIARGTVDNIIASDPAAALSGPLARGDSELVAHQLAALDGWNDRAATLYRMLGGVAVDLVERRAMLSPKKIEDLREALAANKLNI